MYHLTPRDIGNKCILIPQGKDTEADLPSRICVAPSVAQCLIALPSDKFDSDLYIYKVNKQPDQKGTKYDTSITEEHWFLTPVEAILDSVIKASVLNIIYGLVHGDDSGIETKVGGNLRLAYLKAKLDLLQAYLMRYPNENLGSNT